MVLTPKTQRREIMARVIETVFDGGTEADLRECHSRLQNLIQKRGTLDKCIGVVVTSTRAVLLKGKQSAVAMLTVAN